MRRPNPWQSYRTVATQTALPGQLVQMLYEGAIRFLEKSLTGFQYDDPLEFNQTINHNIQRAQAIINELDASLNIDQGGELSQTLRRLYQYMDRTLQQSNLNKEKETIEDVLGRLRLLRDAWSEMLQQNSSAPNAERLEATIA
jgi:flagellar protein FliS